MESAVQAKGPLTRKTAVETVRQVWENMQENR
jgi:hypothetical protein